MTAEAQRAAGAETLILHGVPSSQPSRAVYWTCLIKGLPFDLTFCPDYHYYSGQEFARLNPMGRMPVIIDGDYALYEMPAILCYLCDKHGWPDLYPVELQVRGLINQYLFAHVTLTRLATLKLMATHVTPAFGGVGDDEIGVDVTLREMINSALRSPDMLEKGRRIVGRMVGVIEKDYLGQPTRFFFNHPNATIADIACYEELAQLEWANIFDYSSYPKVQRWMSAMKELPHHDTAHRYNLELGDIFTTPNTIERYMMALLAGVEVLRDAGMTTTVIEPN